MKHPFFESVQDTHGNVLSNADVYIYLTGTTTPAKVYDVDGNLKTTAPQMRTNEIGFFYFSVDDADYNSDQLFDIKITKTGYTDLVIRKIKLIPRFSDVSSSATEIDDAVNKRHAHPIPDTTPIVKGSDDATKQVRFEVDGLTSGTTRVITMPDKDITPADNADLQAHKNDTDNPHNVTKSQIGLGNVENIKCKFDATSAPTASDDSTKGYSVGSRWVDTENDRVYVCVDATEGAAIWKGFAKSGVNDDITSMTGLDDDGIPASKIADGEGSGLDADLIRGLAPIDFVISSYEKKDLGGTDLNLAQDTNTDLFTFSSVSLNGNQWVLIIGQTDLINNETHSGWLHLHVSDDNGNTWTSLSTPETGTCGGGVSTSVSITYLYKPAAGTYLFKFSCGNRGGETAYRKASGDTTKTYGILVVLGK